MPPDPRRTVLIVEDDSQLRSFYRTVLAAAGYRAVSVEDGIQALRYVELERPDLIVLDMVLPRLGGRDVQREIAAHAETRDIPIMVVSGAETRDLNPEDFACILSKPITADALVEAVDACLRRYVRRSEAT